MPDPMSEQIPGLGGTPTMPGSSPQLQQLLAMLKIAQGQKMAPQAPTATGAPAAPGGPPPNIVTPGMGHGAPVQNLAMSPAQAGGPAARGQVQGYQGPTEFRSPQARTGAVVDGAIKSLQSFAMQTKQQKFESEAAQAQVIALASIAKQKQQQGQQLTAQDMQALEGAAKLEKKAPKIIEKAMTDPMSGAYVGVQRAYSAYQQQQMQEATMQGLQAKAAAEQALAKQREAEAQFYAQYKGQNEAAKIAGKQDADFAKLQQQGMIKGIKVEKDENGKVTQRPFTEDEINADPVLKSQQAKEKAYTNAAVARVKQGDLRLQIEAARLDQSKQRLALDTQYKLAQIDKIKNGTMKDKYSTDELRRMSLATMGKNYLGEMQTIAKKRPDLFGQAGWGQNAFNVAMGNKDPDAMRYATLANLVAQPIVGIHGSRSMQLVRELQNFNSALYQNSDVVNTKLATEVEAMDGAVSAIENVHQMKPSNITGSAPSDAPPSNNGKSSGTNNADDNNPLGLNLPKRK